MQLTDLGWNSFFQDHWNQLNTADLTPGRIMGVQKNSFTVCSGGGEYRASLAGRFSHHSKNKPPLPTAGDWVALKNKRIMTILPRQNALLRGSSGYRNKKVALPSQEQVLAANIDTVFVVCGLDRDFNLRRIERYLTLIYNCGLTPAIILTKKDLHADVSDVENQVSDVAIGVPIYILSAKFGDGLAPLQRYLDTGKTTALVGSSGAGKSTLVNRLVGRELQATAGISPGAGNGVHTTTSRDLIVLPNGGMLIDTPGLREIAFWDDDGGIERVFDDIFELAVACRFSDCTHRHEPGCRIKRALLDGELSKNRFESYCKMRQELHHLAQRQTKSADRIEKERWKKVTAQIRRLPKYK